MEISDALKSQITLQLLNDMDSVINSSSTSTSATNGKMRSSNSMSGAGDVSLARVSAEEMDEKRQQQIAYEYLCHLEEAKKWIESCIKEELPPTTECEENLRNGVYLAKLSNFFCPEKVPFKKIFDKDQSRYKLSGLQFRHTDNINHWFNAMEYIGLPKIFFPETTDIYDRKNMPRVVYCLHALSLYLFKLGIAPQIQDLYGVAKFTDEEITTMARELQKYGLQLPAFSKIGGILANEMPVDEVALHAAILAINDSIEKRNLDSLLTNLKLYDAHLYNIFDEYIRFYHECMHQAKMLKSSVSKSKLNDSNYIADVYDELLTQVEIQNCINKVNVDKLIKEISKCISDQDSECLLKLLKSKASPFKNVIDKNADWYMAQLTQENETKLSTDGIIDKDLIQTAINIANLNADTKNKCLKLVQTLNQCITSNKRDEFLDLIKSNADVFISESSGGVTASMETSYAGALYFLEFKYIREEKQSALDLEDFQHGLKVLNCIVDINHAIDHTLALSAINSDEYDEDALDALVMKLANPSAHLQDVRISPDLFKHRYAHSLLALKQYKNNNNSINGSNHHHNGGGAANGTDHDSDKKTNMSLSDDSEDSSDSSSHVAFDNPIRSSSTACNLLTHGEIQESISQVNADYEQECLAVALINDSLNKDNYSHTLYLIKSSLPRDEKLVIIDQNAFIYHSELKNLKLEKDVVRIEDIREKIQQSNLILENALNMTKTMILLNQIDENKKNEIINLIRDKSLGIRVLNDAECQDLYYQTFKDLKRICKNQGLLNNEYFWNKTVEEYDFYLNLKNANVYSWTMPLSFTPTPNLITRTILKKAVDVTTEKFEMNMLYKSKESLIVLIQALARGFLVRRFIRQRFEHFRSREDQIIKLQSWWRMTRERRNYVDRKKFFVRNVRAVIKIQSVVKMWLQRKRFVERKHFLKSNEASIIKIQAFIRAKKARNDYLSLIHDKNPSLRVVRRFVHLLEHNNTDFTEEIELQELKRQIITAIKMNKNLEQDLDMMDIKIGLLVKNRITLQDVLAQHKKLKKYKEDIELNQTNGIKQLSKENHDKMELYQNLFYLLQTNPIYLAKLLFVLPITNTSKFIETVVLQLFNYGANSREEYLLLKLFTTSLQQEIDLKVDKLSDIITGTPLVIKVIVSLYRKHRGENVLRSLLHQTVEEFLALKNIQLCLNPSDLYKAWINKLESETGKPSGYPYDITNQKALEYSEVRKQLDENIRLVKTYTSKFLQLIIKSIDKLPYGLRYIAKVLRSSLKMKFPTASDREILKIIGNLVYYRFINSAICSPDAYDVIDLKAGNTLDSEQRKNLACIAKHLQLISMSKGYGDTENAHLACLNPFIKESHELIRSYFYEVCSVCEADEYFGINEYSDLVTLTKPVVYMTVQEICDTHRILVEYLDRIAPDDPNDPLREIFKLLHYEPNLDSLTENLFNSRTSTLNGSSAAASSHDTLTRNNLNKNTQLCLTLTNRFMPSGDEKTDLNSLFIRTKRFIVEIIHCQSGETLLQILKTPATPEQEQIHEKLLKKREKNDKLMNPEYQRISKTLYSSLDAMKKEVRQNLIELEKAKMVSSQNNYQIIISRIAQDIRNQRKHRTRRQKELAHLQDVYKVLQKKHNLLKEQVSYYNEYVKACLDSFNSKRASGRSKNPFKRKEEKLVGSIKYTGAKLHDKGVILEIDGLQPNQFKNVIFEISTTDEPGTFEVSAKFMGVTMEKVELVFQDLLQMQYEGASIMKMFDKAKINVNLLIFLLNKKFYGK